MDRQIGAMDPPNGPAVACDMGCSEKIMSSTVKCILIWDVSHKDILSWVLLKYWMYHSGALLAGLHSAMEHFVAAAPKYCDYVRLKTTRR
jgi:hypothetical protein